MSIDKIWKKTLNRIFLFFDIKRVTSQCGKSLFFNDCYKVIFKLNKKNNNNN